MRTVDPTTSASLPGRLAISRRRYARYFCPKPEARWFFLFGSFLPWFMRGVPTFGRLVWHWTQTREHFLYGCLNPAIVLDARAGLVAVFTNLTAIGNKPTPVVKIKRERLDLIDPARVENGARFASVAVYFSSPECMARGHWADFNPIVVDCLVSSRSACENALERLQPTSWQALRTGLRSIENRQEIGLHHVDVPHDIARDTF